MDTFSFRKLRTAVQENTRPADGRSVVALQGALREALLDSRLFSEVELGCTDDPDRMVIGLCRCKRRVSPWEAGRVMERLWRTASADSTWEAHVVGSTESLMELEGAASVGHRGRYVTVHLVAQPSEWAAQAARGSPEGRPVAGVPAPTVDA
jgi:hypothetical protein